LQINKNQNWDSLEVMVAWPWPCCSCCKCSFPSSSDS